MAQQEHNSRAHHRYSMSTLNYREACAGYTPRGGTSEAAEDGTRLHEIMDRVAIRMIERATFTSRSATDALDHVLKNETVSDDEEFYLRYCCEELNFWTSRVPLRVLREENVSISNPDGGELNNGYYDLALFLTETSVVMFDWKFGWIPVPAARDNLQGMGYSTAFLQKYPRVKTVGFVFAQPKLHKTTRCHYTREQLPEMYQRVRGVIAAAQAPSKTLRPGMYCDYCAVASTCTGLIKDAASAVAIHEGMPMPTTFTGLQISTPEEAAKALYVLTRLEVLIEQSGLKDRVKEFARLNGGLLQYEIQPGKTVVVELRNRNAPRSVDSPALIADVLHEYLTPEQVLSACDPKITRLEEIFADAFVDKRKAEADAILAAAETKAKAQNDRQQADAIRAKAEQEAKALRTTKKQAREILASTLLAEGLMSASSGQVEYLKVRVEKQASTQPQLENGKSINSETGN